MDEPAEEGPPGGEADRTDAAVLRGAEGRAGVMGMWKEGVEECCEAGMAGPSRGADLVEGRRRRAERGGGEEERWSAACSPGRLCCFENSI